MPPHVNAMNLKRENKDLLQEIYQLKKAIQSYKEAARINLDLLSLTLDFAKHPECETELRKVHILVDLILNDEKSQFVDPDAVAEELSDEEMYNEQEVYMKEQNTSEFVDPDAVAEEFSDEKIYDEPEVYVKERNTSEIPCGILAQPNKMNCVVKKNNLKSFKQVRNDTGLHSSMDGAAKTFFIQVDNRSLEGGVLSLKPTEMMNEPDDVCRSTIGKDGLYNFADQAQTETMDDDKGNTVVIQDQEAEIRMGDNSKAQTRIGLEMFNRKRNGVVGKNDLISCTYCSKVFRKKYLPQHKRIHTRTEKPFKCLVCSKRFCSNPTLKSHHDLFHSGGASQEYKCKLCDRSYKRQVGLRLHMKHHTQEPIARQKADKMCDRCGKVLTGSKVQLRNHIAGHFKCKQPYRCSACSKEFLLLKEFCKHMTQTHPTVRPFKCNVCDKAFGTPRLMKSHSKRNHQDSLTVPCNLCSKSFHSNGNLRRHLKLHYSSKPHRCRLCGSGFAQQGELVGHMKVCTRQPRRRSNACKHCDRVFLSKDDLHGHMEVHREIVAKTFHKCCECDKSFHLLRLLERHMDFHQREKSFKCSLCEAAFHSDESLTKHQNTHPICEICGKVFENASNKLRHKRCRHTGVKPYSCDVCGRQFGQKVNLDTHMWTHRVDKKFSCNHCGRGFNDKRNLQSHSKSHSAAEWTGDSDLVG